jgi:hypothetical protein
MTHTRRILFLALASIIALMIAGCTTAPAFDPALPAVVLSRASAIDVGVYGRNFDENPYLEPKTLIRGKLNEFFIVKIQFNLASESRVSIIAEAVTADGKQAARVYDTQGFIAYWESNIYKDDDVQKQRKFTSIERSCVPAMDFKQGAGQAVLYLPMVGANPIPRPAKIYVQVAISSGESIVFDYILE